MASSTVAPCVSRHNGHGSAYLKTSQAAELLGVSASQIRLLMEAGEISGWTSPSGHRHIDRESCLAYMGFSSEDVEGREGGPGKIACYIRVSSEGQDRAGSLVRQKQRLCDEVCRLEGCKPADIVWYEDVASSFGARKGLNSLVDSMLNGEVKVIYCEKLDRISRVPSLTRLLEHLAEKTGTVIRALDIDDEEEDSMKVLTAELLNYCTVVSNRISARKSALVTSRNLSQEAVERATALRSKGVNLTKIWQCLNKEGFKNSAGEAVSYYLLKRHFDGNGSESLTKAAIGQNPDIPHPPVEQFLQKHLQILPEGGYDGKIVRVKTRDLYKAYAQFCKQRKVEVDAHSNFGLALKKVIPPSRKLRTMGYTCWLGCRLVGLNGARKGG